MGITVENTIRLRDRVSDVMSKISKTTKTMGTDSEKATSKARRGMDIMTTSTDRAGHETDQLKLSVDRAKNSVNGLAQVSNNGSWFKGIGSGIVYLNQAAQLIGSMTQKVKELATTADDFTMIKARIASMTRTGEDAVQNQKDIAAAAARAGVSYRDFAGFVTKVGSMAKGAFGSTEEVTRFAELLNKASSAEGFSGSGLNDAMTQLTQGLASGTLRGEELNSVLEQATPIAMRVAKSLGMVDKNGFADTGKLRDYASKGLLTAQQVKNAILSQQKDIEEAFGKMPKTFGSIWQVASDKALLGLQPLFDKFSNWLNKAGGAQKITALFTALGAAAMAAGNAIFWIKDNWNIIFPLLITGLAIAAFAWFTVGHETMIAGQKATLTGGQMIVAGWASFKAGLKAAAGWIAVNWQFIAIIGTIGLLIAFWGDLGNVGQTIGMVIVGILVLVALSAKFVKAELLAAGASGFIAGLQVFAAWMMANLPLVGLILTIGVLIALWDVLGRVGQAVGLALVVVLGMIALYAFLAGTAIGFMALPLVIIIGIIALVAIAFVYFGDTAAEVCGYIGGTIGALGAYFENLFIGWYNIVAAFVNFFANVFNNPVYSIKKLFVDLANSVIGIIKSIAAAIDKVLGTDMSGGLQSLQTKMSNWLGEQPDTYKAVMDVKEYKSISDSAVAGYNTGKAVGKATADFASGLVDKAKNILGGGKNKAADVAGYVPPKDTTIDNIGKVDEVGKIGKDVEISDEDLKYMRDIGRVKFINQFTTLQPKVDATFGDVRETADVNQLIKALAKSMQDAQAAALS